MSRVTVWSPAGLCVKMPHNFNSLSVLCAPPSPTPHPPLQAVTEGVDGTVSLSMKLVLLTSAPLPACPLSLSCPTLPPPPTLTFPTATLLSSLKNALIGRFSGHYFHPLGPKRVGKMPQTFKQRGLFSALCLTSFSKRHLLSFVGESTCIRRHSCHAATHLKLRICFVFVVRCLCVGNTTATTATTHPYRDDSNRSVVLISI